MKRGLGLVPLALSSCVSALSAHRATNCIWELTYRCNASCGICSYWRNAVDPDAELKIADLRRGADRVVESGCRFVNFSGGEPTLRADLEEIVSYVSHSGLFTSMVSNGSLLDESRIDALKEAGLDNLFISLDFADERHDTLRGIEGLSGRVKKVLAYLGDSFISGHRTAGIMCVVSRLNLGDFEELVHLAGSLGVYIEFQLYHDRKTGETTFNAGEVAGAVGALLKLKKDNWNVISSAPYLERMLDYRDNVLPRCSAGNKYFSVDPYGYLHPCVDLPAVGHILRDDVSVLQSGEAQALVEQCSGCWYCFRGESDISCSVQGCMRRASQYARILYRSQRKPRASSL